MCHDDVLRVGVSGVDRGLETTSLFRQRRKPLHGFTLIELLVVISIIALLIGILLPALAIVRIKARQMQSNTHLRGIHQAMVTFAQGNRQYFPGLDGEGKLVLASANPGTDQNGAVPRARFSLLLRGGYFTGEYAISPHESDTPWNASVGTITKDHHNYALLALDLNNDAVKDANGRTSEWRDTLNSQAPAVSDRNTGANATTQVSSIWTTKDGGQWTGGVAYGDNHVELETTQVLANTRLGSGANVTSDNLFAQDNDASAAAGNDAAMVYQDAATLTAQD